MLWTFRTIKVNFTVLSEPDWQLLGTLLGNSPTFKEGCKILLRIFENKIGFANLCQSMKPSHFLGHGTHSLLLELSTTIFVCISRLKREDGFVLWPPERTEVAFGGGCSWYYSMCVLILLWCTPPFLLAICLMSSMILQKYTFLLIPGPVGYVQQGNCLLENNSWMMIDLW